ncbi:alpha-L-rhamnosidase C-terminal domain-containing protein [Micromonospora sp. 4G57]|uniref:Alpha-L-rhamnosidase C-terminal domain-containing protein n=1 Tax=Micromonospora sicca TaxID=2202420 RepID=A0ABU5JBM5_9ACTN|nr:MULTISPECIES: alpha-L-rhamnosidase C-terminal domain-containing protein [unclassified Micromonospora]MDZ5441539.1 alpha-L-rhamnosidase C-terminal domain-containing protein [Micromonospora sp. 4G57]MDZ5489936.1 alpha-L-rhamnosidase C-terminal domain-containing protein [Micromonospora sp. 4G53]
MRRTRFAAISLTTAAVLVASTGVASAESGGLAAPAPGDWQRYVLTPQTRDVAPLRVVSADSRGGEITNPAGVLAADGQPVKITKTGAGADPRLIVDFGREVSGYLSVDFAGAAPTTLFAFSETLGYLGDWGDTFGTTSWIANGDASKPQRERRFESPHEQAPAGAGTWQDPELRGGFRYLMIRLAPEATAGSSVSVDAVRVRYTAAPGINLADRDALLPGWFLSSDDALNKIWYGGAHTIVNGTIDPTQGIENGTETIGVGERVIVDGAKRDRLAWNGDLAITGRIAYVSTDDRQAMRDSLRSIARTQRGDGYLSACSPNGLGAPVCQGFLEYHLWWLRGLQEYYLYTGDTAFVAEMWPTFTSAMAFLETRLTAEGFEGTEAQDSAPKLLPGHTQGQTFTATSPFTAAGGRFPTYNTTGADMTLSLYRGQPGAGQLVASKRFEDVVDNAWLMIDLPEAAAPGAYYLEQSDPSGTVAWWTNSTDAYPQGTAMTDGKPIAGDRTLRIATVSDDRTRLLDLYDQGGHWIYGDSGKETEVNALYVEVLRDAAAFAELQNDNPKATHWRELIPEVVRGVNDQLWNETAGAYRQSTGQPGNIAQDGNVFAVLSGVAPADRAARALDTLKDQLWTAYGSKSGTGSMPQLVGPFMNYWEAVARFDEGRDAEAWHLLRTVWGYQFAQRKPINGVEEPPATGAWEHINLDGSPYRHGDGSMSHPWSAGGTALLTNEVLGVRPAGPGFATYTVKPHPGDLEWAQGRVPTPHGAIWVSWRQDRGRDRFVMDLTTPQGTTGTIAVPADGPTTVIVDGRLAWNGDKAKAYGAHTDGRYVYLSGLPAGAHTISAHPADEE